MQVSGSGQVTGDNCFSTTYKYSTDGTSGSITITGTMDSSPIHTAHNLSIVFTGTVLSASCSGTDCGAYVKKTYGNTIDVYVGYKDWNPGAGTTFYININFTGTNLGSIVGCTMS